MLALRSRTMPLIASTILFASFFFATVHLGEGLKCYSCVSEGGGDCATLNNVSSVECTSTPSPTSSPTSPPTSSSTSPPTSPSTSTTLSPAFFSSEGGESLFKLLQQNGYASEIGNVCFREGVTVTLSNGTELSAVARGCAMGHILAGVEFPEDITITNFELRTCKSDNCNSSGEFQIGVISLFLPLIASLLVTR